MTDEKDWYEIMVICDNCGHAIHAKRENCKVSAQPEIIRCKDCIFSSSSVYCGELDWVCNSEDGLTRIASENSFCSSAIERSN